MNPHVGAAMWIIAMLIGFVIWWPIGAMILGAITFTALMQQLTGYQPSASPPYQPLTPVYFDEKGNRIEVGSDYIPPARQITGPRKR